MPSNPRGAPRNQGFKLAIFVDPQLDALQRAELKKAPFSAELADSELTRVFEQNYKLTLKFDERSQAYTAWLLPEGEKHKNSGYILSGRGSTPLKAVKQVLFKNAVFFPDGDWSQGGKLTGDTIDD
jgi:hypothetical protein